MSGLWLREQRECGTPTPYRPRCGRLARRSPQQPEATMSVTQSVATILQEKVTLDIESIDRMYLNVYVPQLQTPAGVAHFFRVHRGATFASSALMAPTTTAFVAALERFARTQGVPLLTFKKGQRKDEVAAPYRAQFQGEEGVLFMGKAQEKATVCRTEKRRNPQTGQPYPWLVQSTAVVNQYYIYAVDQDFGPFFLKFCSYFPYNAKLCLNGHEYLKRQLRQEGIAFAALDNGLLSCADPVRAQEICDGLAAPLIDRLLRKWLARLPHPFTPEDRDAGYRYDVSILQAEFALTQVLDRPLTGRVFFEEVIRENLDLGRPDHVQLIFNRRVSKRTPGRFRTRVLTQGVASKGVREHLARLLGLDPGTMTPGQLTYDLRRLRLHGLIERLPGTHRYRVTREGLRTALFFTRVYARILRPGLARIAPAAPSGDAVLRPYFAKLEVALDHWIDQAKLAA